MLSVYGIVGEVECYFGGGGGESIVGSSLVVWFALWVFLGCAKRISVLDIGLAFLCTAMPIIGAFVSNV